MRQPFHVMSCHFNSFHAIFSKRLESCAASQVYWTALCCGLRRANLQGSNEELVTSADFASGVAVLEEDVYWADWMQGRILRHHMASGREEAIVTGLASPVDVALDAVRKEIYWSDVGLGRTQRASLETRKVETLNMSWAIMTLLGRLHLFLTGC